MLIQSQVRTDSPVSPELPRLSRICLYFQSPSVISSEPMKIGNKTDDCRKTTASCIKCYQHCYQAQIDFWGKFSAVSCPLRLVRARESTRV